MDRPLINSLHWDDGDGLGRGFPHGVDDFLGGRGDGHGSGYGSGSGNCWSGGYDYLHSLGRGAGEADGAGNGRGSCHK
jgi:hypothetical protein